MRDFSNSKATDHLKGDNGSEYKGVLIHSQSSLLNMITTSSQLGYRLEIHAIGDKAAETVLDALIDCYSQSLPEGMKEHWRPILTHCQILGPDLLEKMRTIGAIANIQPSFVPTGNIPDRVCYAAKKEEGFLTRYLMFRYEMDW